MEIWKDIVGYEGHYQVSNMGRVRGLTRKDSAGRTKEGKVLKPKNNGGGYLIVSLCKNGKIKYKLIHRLVAQAFLQDYDEDLQVNHKDENKNNNKCSNLEMMTCKENNNYGTHNKRVSKTKSKEVFGVNLENGSIVLFPSTVASEESGFNQGAVASCGRGEIKTHKGYIWYYVEDIKYLYY